jgi:hypothetical protein
VANDEQIWRLKPGGRCPEQVALGGKEEKIQLMATSVTKEVA